MIAIYIQWFLDWRKLGKLTDVNSQCKGNVIKGVNGYNRKQETCKSTEVLLKILELWEATQRYKAEEK